MREHEELVTNLTKSGIDIIDGLTPEMAHLWHMGTGVAGEAGELLDAIKKHVVYGQDLDLTNVIEELGDLEFYYAGIRIALGITREQILEYNMNKLTKRYGVRYSDGAAIARVDKNE